MYYFLLVILRILRMRISRYQVAFHTKRFLPALQEMVDAYNNTVHKSIKMRPVDLWNSAPNSLIHLQAYLNLVNTQNVVKKPKRKRLKPKFPLKAKFSVGDKVRIERHRGRFDNRESSFRYTEEYFSIDSVDTNTRPHTYRLKDWLGKPIAGKFAAWELQKIEPPETFHIESILDQRKLPGKEEEVKIKWKDWPLEHATWEPASSVFNL